MLDNEPIRSQQDSEMPPSMAMTSGPYQFMVKDEESLLGEEMALRYHFNKSEEKEIKKARRRIKNKLSAQESRKRKKEYIDGLEKRMRHKERDNIELREKIFLLERRVRTLTTQMTPRDRTPCDTAKSCPSQTCNLPIVVRTISRSTQTGVCLYCFENRHQPPRTVSSPVDSARLYFEHEMAREYYIATNSEATTTTLAATSNRIKQERPISLDLEHRTLTRGNSTGSGFQEVGVIEPRTHESSDDQTSGTPDSCISV